MPCVVTATAALSYWRNSLLQEAVEQKSGIVQERLAQILRKQGAEATVRGRGLIQGVEFADAGLASRISKACFERGLIIETAGIDDQVLKLLPSLTIRKTSCCTALTSSKPACARS